MAEHNLSHVTSTPSEFSNIEQSSLSLNLTVDSGYLSNSLGCMSRTSSSSFLNGSKFSPDSQHLDSINEQGNSFSEEKVKFKNTHRNTKRVPNSWQHSNAASPKLNLTGKTYVDFLHYLGDWYHHTIVVKKILSELSDHDLHNASNVSKTWRHIIYSMPSEERRLRSYVKEIETSKENRGLGSSERNSHPLEDVRRFTTTTPRNMLAQIQNIQESASSSSASSSEHKHSYRFEAYQKEARKLKYGKRLFSCPKCKLPSHMDPRINNSAQCTNSTCKYRFCILCQCEEHHFKLCDFISTPLVRKQNTTFGTAKNKKNLRRLLL